MTLDVTQRLSGLLLSCWRKSEDANVNLGPGTQPSLLHSSTTFLITSPVFGGAASLTRQVQVPCVHGVMGICARPPGGLMSDWVPG